MESWLTKSGAVGLSDLELAEFPDTGRGVKTLRRFKQGEKILTIPSDVLWSVEHAYGDPLLGPAIRSSLPPLTVEDILAIYILFVRSRESGYDGRRTHVSALPGSYSSSIFFSEEELGVCAGSSLYTITKQLEQRIQDDYKHLVVRLLEHHPDLFPLDKFTLEDYKWALCTVWSRSMDFTLPTGSSIRLLAPFADMLNHSSEVKQCHAYDVESGDLSVLAGKDYEVGDQVYIYYGPIPNNRLLRLYGFVIPDNPHDSYDLVLTTHPMAPFYEQKQKLWVSAGLDSTTTVSLTLTDPLPRSILRYLRIQRADVSGLATLSLQQMDGSYEKISDSNETEILRFLEESIGNLLDGFAASLETLESRLTEGVYAVGGNAWAAAHVSVGEQRVLRLAREQARHLLAAVESGRGSSRPPIPARCANCDKDSVPLMFCGRCKTVMYCGRTCQVAHYKQHKAACRAAAPVS
ncbi:N-methyltransferase [Trichoderma longibrachiatum]|uniref:N-methyltransferase n=1 Tax=Trichoderma longibrachiatum ATCC 18648 TaxID=983965 RepID=A0A2T4C4Y9_TRILO|nr:N-methyltransferase [Trichoderma longibrachiatum ATCC 18648]